MRHIERNLCTLKYTYSYTLIYTLHIEYTENNILLHKKIIDPKRIIQYVAYMCRGVVKGGLESEK